MRSGNRHDSYGTRNKLSPWAIVGIVAASVLLITLIIGNLLKVWLDGEALKQLTDGEPETKAEEPLYKAAVRDRTAYPFLLGNDLEAIVNTPEISLSLNTPDGKVNYTSPVTERFALPIYRNTPLDEGMGDLQSVAEYVSGVFYPQALSIEDADLRYAEMMAECALLREFIGAGGNEILLSSLPYSTTDLGALLSYITSVKRALGTSPLGVAVPMELVLSENAWKTLEQLLKICDFLALELGDSQIPISELTYYLKHYDMRLLLDASAAEQIAAAEESLTDYQILTTPPKPEPKPEETDPSENENEQD